MNFQNLQKFKDFLDVCQSSWMFSFSEWYQLMFPWCYYSDWEYDEKWEMENFLYFWRTLNGYEWFLDEE